MCDVVQKIYFIVMEKAEYFIQHREWRYSVMLLRHCHHEWTFYLSIIVDVPYQHYLLVLWHCHQKYTFYCCILLVFHTKIRPYYLSIAPSKNMKRILNADQRTAHAPSSVAATTYMGTKTREKTYCLLPRLFPHSELLPGAPFTTTVGSPLPWPNA